MFKEIMVEYTEEPLDESDIERLELVVGKKLPAEYWAWMRLFNGGMPQVSVFYIPSEKGGFYSDSFVRQFYFVSSKVHSARNLLTKIPRFRELQFFDSDLIPVAEDSFGNKVLLSVREKDYGQVFFWDHELDGEEAVSFVAKDWVTFINMLEPSARRVD